MTVPMARVVANNPQLPKPFKRYCIARAWRYEEIRKDRFREFWQCDVDTVGSSSMEADAEILAVAVDSLKALGFKKFIVKLNNRKILSALIDYVDVPKKKKYDVFRAIDKLDKFGEDTVKDELKKAGLKPKQKKELLELIKMEGSPEEMIKKAENILQSAIGFEGLSELKKIVEISESYGFIDRIVIDFSLARGLDYYTGPIFEVSITSNIGPV